VINHIRYSQHLAMMDDRFSPDDIGFTGTGPKGAWQASRWQIYFKKCTANDNFYYEVYSDRDREGNSDSIEEAKDPMTQESLGDNAYGVGANCKNYLGITNLTSRFKINNITFSGTNCVQNATSNKLKSVAFDELGRPYNSVTYSFEPYKYFQTNKCLITLIHPTEGSSYICIEPITGYTHQVATAAECQ